MDKIIVKEYIDILEPEDGSSVASLCDYLNTLPTNTFIEAPYYEGEPYRLYILREETDEEYEVRMEEEREKHINYKKLEIKHLDEKLQRAVQAHEFMKTQVSNDKVVDLLNQLDSKRKELQAMENIK